MWTPFLRVTSTYPGKDIGEVWAPDIVDHPPSDRMVGDLPRVIPQLMATNADDFVRVGEMIIEKSTNSAIRERPFWVDLNCGCPSPVVVGGRAGSSLLQNPEFLRDFITSAVARLGANKISIKMRVGYDEASEFPDILDALSGLALAQVAVHGRTRPERYLGRSRLGMIQQAAIDLSHVPVVGSGDICDFKSAQHAISVAPAASSWIVGRGALRNPWIFLELRQGDPVGISLDTLRHSFLAFALLHDLYWHHPVRLLRLWRDGVFHSSRICGNDPQRWAFITEQLQSTLVAPGVALIPSRRSVSRTKMLWNYFRSSLPVPVRDGTLLRAGTIADLFAGIDSIWRDLGRAEILLAHDPGWDWVYNGSGKSKASGGMEFGSAAGNKSGNV
jgi:tRNA-dihydrouridine synthase